MKLILGKSMPLLHAMVVRRGRRGYWAYMLWLVAYMPMMVWITDFVLVHPRPWQYLPLLIPISIVLVQFIHPTLLGWTLIIIPSVFVAGVAVVSVVITVPASDLPHDLPRLVISSIAAGLYVLVCFVFWHARPKRMDSATTETVVPEN
jgi:hypothetical protein